jgi:hypothetical protein
VLSSCISADHAAASVVASGIEEPFSSTRDTSGLASVTQSAETEHEAIQVLADSPANDRAKAEVCGARA